MELVQSNDALSKRFDNYSLKCNIGNGSFGSVFKCYNHLDKNTYALKIIKLLKKIVLEKFNLWRNLIIQIL